MAIDIEEQIMRLELRFIGQLVLEAEGKFN